MLRSFLTSPETVQTLPGEVNGELRNVRCVRADNASSVDKALKGYPRQHQKNYYYYYYTLGSKDPEG